MIDPVTASNDCLQDSGRWGYTGDLVVDSTRGAVEESAGPNRWFL